MFTQCVLFSTLYSLFPASPYFLSLLYHIALIVAPWMGPGGIPILVRLIKGVNADGVSMKRSPVLAKPNGVNAVGILSALKTDDWGVQTSGTSDWIATVNFAL